VYFAPPLCMWARGASPTHLSLSGWRLDGAPGRERGEINPMESRATAWMVHTPGVNCFYNHGQQAGSGSLAYESSAPPV
jgi:hypothetical protein